MHPFEKTWAQVIVLLVVALPAFFLDFGSETRLDGREVIHAEISREMAESGQFAAPRVCGKPYIDKPPLFNWSIALLFDLTGRVNLAVARFPSALCALLAMLGVYILGTRLATRQAGFWAALIWTSSWLVIEWARFSRGDMMMACLILWAIVLADMSVSAGSGWRSWLFWSAASFVVAGAVMSKGAQALFFFGVAVVLLWRARRSRWVPPVAFIAVTLVISAAFVTAWVLAAEAQHPGQIKALVNYEYGEGLIEHFKRLYFYFDQILMRTAPWGIFVPGAIYCTIRHMKRMAWHTSFVPALMVGISLILMTILPNKRAHYLLPILPFWALFIAVFLDRAVPRSQSFGGIHPPEEERLPRWALHFPLEVALALAIVAMSVLALLWPSVAHGGKLIGVVYFALLALFSIYGLMAAWRRWNERALTMLFVIMAILAMWGYPLAMRFYSTPDPQEGVRAICSRIPRGVPVAEWGIESSFLYFKLNRPVTFAKDEGEARSFLAEPGRRFFIVRAGYSQDFMPPPGRSVREVGEWAVGEGEHPAAVKVFEVLPEGG